MPDIDQAESSRRDAVACALLTIAAMMLTHPRAAMPFVDEWSYMGSARTLERTGHLRFYGESAMVGWQLPWGALFLKLFGETFDVARSSMLPFAGLAVFLMHRCLRRFGVGRAGAILGALTLGLSPLFLPVATSFMTDSGALFGVLVCLYLCQRAIAAESDRTTVQWLCAASLSNALLGTDRQVVWLGMLVMVPSTAWLLRRRNGVLPVAAALWLASLVLVRTAMQWFNRQPNILPARLIGHVHPRMVEDAAMQMGVRIPLCLLLLLFPVTIGLLARLPQLGHRAVQRVCAGLLAVVATGGALAYAGRLESALMPWMRPMIGNLGIWRLNDELPGAREVTLGVWTRCALTLLVLATLMALLEWLWAMRGATRTGGRDRVLRWRALWATIGMYSAAYAVLLLPVQMFKDGIYDRYVLLLLPLALIVTLKFLEERLSGRVPAVCFAALAVISAYTVLATHDWYSLLRAHVANADRVLATGVPRTALLGGTEYDAWTQIEAQGFLNYPEGVQPPGKVYTKPAKRKRPCEQGIVDWTPAIDPKYALSYSSVPCYVPSEFSPLVYRTWLPPFERRLSVMRVLGDP